MKKMYSVTVSEWKSVHKRLDDLETIVKELKSKLELNGNEYQSLNSNVETQDSVESDRVEHNTHSNSISANSPIPGPSSTVHGDQESLTLTSEVSGLQLAPTSSGVLAANSSTNTSVVTEKVTHAPSTSTASLSSCFTNGIGVEDQNVFEKSRRAVILLKRCDETDVLAERSSFGSKIKQNKKNTSMGHSVKRAHRPNVPRKPTASGSHERRNGKYNRFVVPVGERRYKCLICPRKFNKKHNFLNHARVHAGEKPYQCQFCSKCFSQQSHMTSHIKIHTREKPYTCHVCAKTFSHLSSKTRHVRTHTGEKPYQCQFCAKGFSQRSDLMLHTHMHTGEKPHTCHACAKSFKYKASLRVHLRLHTGERPYNCQLCPKAFNNSYNLKTHLRVHTGEKLYRCRFCSKCFSQRTHLTFHTQVHTGEKPYNCQYCPMAYRWARCLTAHLRTHSADEPL